jgi:CheY-like chemotaxis protein
VVDDRRENCDILARMLTEVGCDVRAAAGGREALTRVREEVPQIIFLDLLMPDMDGIAAARALLAATAGRGCKIVMQTAAALAEYRDAAGRAGCVDLLVKPIRAEQLYECLRTHLGVEFEYDAPPEEAEPPSAWNAAPLPVSEDLYARLATAAELHSTTALKACLLELRQLGPEAGRLAEHIRHLMRSYDMDGILHLIMRAAAPVRAEALVPPHP